MKDNKLVFAHLCDDAIISRDDGKISIIGIFQEIISRKGKAIHPRIVLVFELSLVDKNNHNLRIEFKDPVGNDFYKQYTKEDISTTDTSKNIGQILNIVNVKLEEKGVYSVKFYIDEIFVGDINFDFIIS